MKIHLNKTKYKSVANEILSDIENSIVSGAFGTGVKTELSGFHERNFITRQKDNPDLLPCKHISTLFPVKKIIIGRDDRTEVTETDYPYNMICLLIIYDRLGNKYFGTGFFIAEKCIATSGHCVYFNNKWVKKIKVIPGAFSSHEPFGSTVATRFRSVEGWTINKDRNFDHGAIILNDNGLFKEVKSYFGYMTLPVETIVEVSGYPADKNMTQWKCEGKISKLSLYRIFYDLDTWKGNSGSPVYIRKGDHHIAIGMHSYGENPNYAIRIKQEIIDRWSEWSKL